jgi:hypothetical protein
MPSRLELQERLYLRAGDGFYSDRRHDAAARSGSGARLLPGM